MLNVQWYIPVPRLGSSNQKEVNVVSRKLTNYLVLGMILIMLASVAAVAQQTVITAQPDVAVRGVGAVALGEAKTLGMFDINIARWSNTPTAALPIGGSISFTELDAKGNRINTVISKEIKAIKVDGNVAEVVATGYLNGKPVEIDLTVLDDNASGDNLRIVAKPLPTITGGPVGPPIAAPYERQGGVIKGDIIVFQRIDPVVFANGAGTILVGQSIGKFTFNARGNSTASIGEIYYAASDPRRMSPTAIPAITISVPKVVALKVDGKTAVLEGVGTLNGKPVKVRVKVFDSVTPLAGVPIVAKDVFSIEAVLEDGTTYTAGGPLTSGDIVVGILPR